MKLLENATSIVLDRTIDANQYVYAYVFPYDENTFELYYPSVYESTSVKISDSYWRFYDLETLDKAYGSGKLLNVDASLPYDTQGWFQPEFLDPVYKGSNPDIITHIKEMQKISPDYPVSIAEVKEYRIPVVWQVMGFKSIEATSLKEALDIYAKAGCPLPDNGEYLEDSFEIDWEGLEDYVEKEGTEGLPGLTGLAKNAEESLSADEPAVESRAAQLER